MGAQYDSFVQVDKGGVDQAISGVNWVKMTALNVLEDINGDYSADDSVFTVPTRSCWYDVEIGALFMNAVNVARVTVGMFKLGETPDLDDLWFVLEERSIGASGRAYLANKCSVEMDVYERCEMRVQLTPTDPELPCSIDLIGNDDYTAWGWGFKRYRAEA